MPTAFVLSGGASLGAAQAGMLQALYEHGIQPDLFVGTSAGALNAAFAAFRAPRVETALELQDVWRRLRRSEVFPPNPLRAGLVLARRLEHDIAHYASHAELTVLPVPHLAAAATGRCAWAWLPARGAGAGAYARVLV